MSHATPVIPPTTTLFGAITSTVSSPSTFLYGAAGILGGSGVRWIIYLLVLGVVVGLLLVAVDTVYPFLPITPVGPSQIARSVKTFWTSASGENLLVPLNQSPTFSPGTYSMSVQCTINSVGSPSNFYKHIVHRGSNPIQIPPLSTAGPTGHAGIQLGDLKGAGGAEGSGDEGYADTGLPAIMNPGIFLDKERNDIHVFVHTQSMEEGRNVLLVESMTIDDVPLGTPLNLGVVCNGQTLEVYLNCRLYNTLLLKGTPYLPSDSNLWWGRYGVSPVNGVVKNLQLWDKAIGSTDFMAMCSTG